MKKYEFQNISLLDSKQKYYTEIKVEKNSRLCLDTLLQVHNANY